MIDYHLLILNTVGNIISCIACLKVLLFSKQIRAYNLIVYAMLLCDFISSLTDAQGKYSRFPGITVVAGIRKNDIELWKQIYNKFDQCELLKNYYSLLPVESYHMTLFYQNHGF